MIHSLWMGLRLWGMVLLTDLAGGGLHQLARLRLAQVVDFPADACTGAGKQRAQGHHFGHPVARAVPDGFRNAEPEQLERSLLHLKALVAPRCEGSHGTRDVAHQDSVSRLLPALKLP